MSDTETLPSDSEELFTFLRQKQGTWVQWGQACLALQRLGENSLAIFENTGFEPIQQNQIVVAAQVFMGLEALPAPTELIEHFRRRGSDILYELRVLSQQERLDMAQLAIQKNLDVLEVKEVVKAVKEASAVSNLPAGFTRHPGDAVGYQVWRACQGRPDAAQKARLIAKGLQYVHSESARKVMEQLLTDLVTPKEKKAPRLPVFRYEGEDAIPRVLPVIGSLPLSASVCRDFPKQEIHTAFAIAKGGTGLDCGWVAVPGWQVVQNARDPILLLTDTAVFQEISGQEIVSSVANKPEEILLLIDRGRKPELSAEPISEQGADKLSDRYYLLEEKDDLKVQWFKDLATAQEVSAQIIGQLLLVLRPQRVMDEEAAKDLWDYES
ncbi:MAG: RuBisCO accumulation factor 1 [Pseudanabaenaceae cyanobacterium]